MANNDAFALQHSDLNGFLFADVGTDASGMPLSVLSTLARHGKDPWQEASRLATLPQAAAIDVLARIIAAMPGSRWPLPDATAIAARLVALLPTHRGGAPSQSRLVNFRLTWQTAIIVALLAAVAAGIVLNLTGQTGSPPDNGIATGWSTTRPARSP